MTYEDEANRRAADARFAPLVDATLREIDEKIAVIRQTRAEIDALRRETHAMLRKLRAA